MPAWHKASPRRRALGAGDARTAPIGALVPCVPPVVHRASTVFVRYVACPVDAPVMTYETREDLRQPEELTNLDDALAWCGRRIATAVMWQNEPASHPPTPPAGQCE